jgi:hypothetical protein
MWTVVNFLKTTIQKPSACRKETEPHTQMSDGEERRMRVMTLKVCMLPLFLHIFKT